MKWTYASTVVTVGLQIGVTALLARLLTPSAFGLVAMANVLLWYGQQFAMMGTGQAIVQKPDLSARDIHTAFTSSLIMGAAFCALFAVLAPLAGILFPDTPGVVAVTRVMSLSFVIGGLTTTTEGLLQSPLCVPHSRADTDRLVRAWVRSRRRDHGPAGFRSVESGRRLALRRCACRGGLRASVSPRGRPQSGLALVQDHLLVRRDGSR